MTSSMPSKRRKMVGYDNFVRKNDKTDYFESSSFAHVEFYCTDATNISRRFACGLGMTYVGKSDQSTGNTSYASYVYQSNDLVFIFTAPYSIEMQKKLVTESSGTLLLPPHASYDVAYAHRFIQRHGLAVRAVGIHVTDASVAFDESVKHGARTVTSPTTTVDKKSNTSLTFSEVELYGDVVLRFLSGDYTGPGLANYVPVEQDHPDTTISMMNFGIQRLDHCVGNVPDLLEAINYICDFTGFHEFAEFTAEDIGTVDSGLNSMVLANNSEMILLPINEPTFGTKRKSQIQTYLEQNEGAGLQHMALKTNDIFFTLSEMRKRSFTGGFEFMPKPSKEYYATLPSRIGDGLTKDQYKKIEALGLLVDKDDLGILLQIFTKPLGDRPTIFIEIIERVGCMQELDGRLTQAAGCGGFGKGNFSELFKSIEKYEDTLKV